MGLFESAIMSACIAGASPGQGQMACQKATEAGGKQTGVEQTVDAYETRETKIFEKKFVDFLGQDSATAVAGSVFLAKSLASRSVSFGLPNFGLCSSIKTEITENTSMLKLEWKF